MKLTRFFTCLRISITDYCNLSCQFCSESLPLTRKEEEPSNMSLEFLEKLGGSIGRKFKIIKISGGEPTSHPDFLEICLNLKRWFPRRSYMLSTNGFLLKKYINALDVFEAVELSRYPKFNDELCSSIEKLNIPNVYIQKKDEFEKMQNIWENSNLANRKNIFKNCFYSTVKSVVGDRIYPCAAIYGQAVRKKIPLEEVSAGVGSWSTLSDLKKINIEEHCRRCYVNVNPKMFFLKPFNFIKRNFKAESYRHTL